MPVYRIRDPKTNRTARIRSDAPPTGEQIRAVFAKLYPPKQQPEVGMAEGIGHNIAQGVTFGFGDEIQALVAAGIAQLTGDAPQDHNFSDSYLSILSDLNSRREGFNKENKGIATASEIGGVLLTGGTGLAKTFGTQAYKNAGTLVKAAMTTGVGATEGALYGAGTANPGERVEGAQTGAAVGALGGAVGHTLVVAPIQNMIKKRKEIKTLLETNPNAKVAKYMLDGAGKMQKDKFAVKAIRQGFEDGTVALVKGASKADRVKMYKMLQIIHKSRFDKRYAALNRSSDVIGESIYQRFKRVKFANRNAANNLDEVAKSLKGQRVDYSGAVSEFTSSLQKMGIRIDPATFKPLYRDSDIEGIGGTQKIVNKVLERMSKTSTPDAYDVHRLKKFIDEHVAYGKSKKGLGGKIEFTLKQLRRNLDDALDNNFDAYRNTNNQFSETRKVIDELQSLVGKKNDLSVKDAQATIGILSRNVLGNSQSRTNLIKTIDSLDALAKKYGGKFDDDVITQIVFDASMKDRFGTAATNSFGGEIASSVRQSIREKGVKGAVTDAVADKAAQALGKNDDEAMRAMIKLVRGRD